MCTAISENYNTHLFGRTLDLEFSYGQGVTLIPKGFEFSYLHERVKGLYSVIGVSHISDGVPLLFDGMNERGLCMAGLNFPNFASYGVYNPNKINLAPWELIPYILRQCTSLSEAIHLLEKINLINESFSSSLPATPLHFMISDRSGSVVVEPCESGIKVYQNPFGILTNSPPFPYQRLTLDNYLSLRPDNPVNTLFPSVKDKIYSRGLGAFGLPGDYSSTSRFIRGAFVKANTDRSGDKINRFFSIMDTLKVPCGVIKTDTGASVSTIYTSCMDASTMTYYFTTSSCHKIKGVTLNLDNSKGDELSFYDMGGDEEISILN